MIAERTGLPVVSDFRVRDVAAGGEGAPLVPLVDFFLFRRPGTPRAMQNIGGIANVTLVQETLEQTIAFDNGPGNMPLDAVARAASGGQEPFDRDGGDWQAIPPSSFVTIGSDGMAIRPFAPASAKLALVV